MLELEKDACSAAIGIKKIKCSPVRREFSNRNNLKIISRIVKSSIKKIILNFYFILQILFKAVAV